MKSLAGRFAADELQRRGFNAFGTREKVSGQLIEGAWQSS